MKIIRCRGIGEPMSENLLSHVTRLIPDVEVVELPWAAQYGPVPNPLGISFDDSVHAGHDLLARELDKGPAVVLGFSGGAVVAGDVAATGHPNLRGVVLVADPCQPRLHPDHWGIAGARPITTTVPRLWIYRHDDPIPMCPRDSPLRTIADQSAAMALGDPFAWAADLIDRLTTQRWQKVVVRWWEPITVWRQYSQAIVDVRNYVVNHAVYDHEHRRIADWVEAL